MTPRVWLVIAALGLLLVLPGTSFPFVDHYVPRAGDGFHYQETIFLSNGEGNYTGYTESSFYNGSISVTGTNPNGTESAAYASSGTYRNSLGQDQPWSESGSFTFSSSTYHYVQGTDNQTGYIDPYVWFYVNSSAAPGSTVWLLNTRMNVVSTDAPFASPLSSTGWASTIATDGNGTYQRHDVYGTFTATYHWTANFDPTTGYIVGYEYVETDTDGLGDGFTWTDRLSDTQTTFALTSTSAPPGGGGGSGLSAEETFALVGVAVLVLVLVIVVAVVVLARRANRGSRAGGTLPRHSSGEAPPPPGAAWTPPPIDLIPRDQPVPQVVLRETVKVPCRFCGTLVDSTATACPKCGAPRT